jgi:hypothetical protein
MERIAARLAARGWKMVSGGAEGADTAWEVGARLSGGSAQIYTPWPKYGKSRETDLGDDGFPLLRGLAHIGQVATSDELLEEAEKFHPKWHSLTPGMRKMMARNVAIILGPSMTEPVDMVLAYTLHGSGKGGTGHGLRVAESRGIPIFDLGDPSFSLQNMKQRIETIEARYLVAEPRKSL